MPPTRRRPAPPATPLEDQEDDQKAKKQRLDIKTKDKTKPTVGDFDTET
jgi:hypothetical protein